MISDTEPCATASGATLVQSACGFKARVLYIMDSGGPLIGETSAQSPTEAEEEDLLAALEQSLDDSACQTGEGGLFAAPHEMGTALVTHCGRADESCPSRCSPRKCRKIVSEEQPSCAEEPIFAQLGYGLVHWPLEVRLCIASFLVWHELVRKSSMCRAWQQIERENAVWQEFFQATWPRLARRWDSGEKKGMKWRSLFRSRWSDDARVEDALEEDWLDFDAASGVGSLATRERARQTAALDMERQLANALRRCLDDLSSHGVRVPSEPDLTHICARTCRFHRLLVNIDVFVCEISGVVHRCTTGTSGRPCDICVLHQDECYMVCPASGRCFPRTIDVGEELAERDAANDWDPSLSATQQFTRWFEQGYSMSEEQAREFFGCARSHRHSGRKLARGLQQPS